jgi:hypothetical protein
MTSTSYRMNASLPTVASALRSFTAVPAIGPERHRPTRNLTGGSER